MEIEGKQDMYSPEAFLLLKLLFDDLASFYQADIEVIKIKCSQYPEALNRFLEMDGFAEKIIEINRYTASFHSFKKRFFNYFNAFKIVKYLNFTHPAYFAHETLFLKSV